MKRTSIIGVFLFFLALTTGFPSSAISQPIPQLLAPDPNPANDFVQNVSLNIESRFLHWDLREFPLCIVPWGLGAGAVPDLDSSGVANTALDRALANAAFTAAFASWTAVAPSLISFVDAGAAPANGLALDGFNTMNFGDGALDDIQFAIVGGPPGIGGVVVAPGVNGLLETQPQGDDLVVGANIVDGGNGTAESVANNQGAVGGALGLTGLFFTNSTGVIVESDVVFSPTQTWLVNPNTNVCAGAGQFNLQGVAAHEIGHFIGIAHPVFADPPVADPADGSTPTLHAFICPAFGGNNFNQTLENSDRDACNFLYTPDLGDAEDLWAGFMGFYPSLVHDPGAGRLLNGRQLDAPATGAEHLFSIAPRQARNYTYEWLGVPGGTDNIDGECESNQIDLDLFDDGVTFFPNPPLWGKPMIVTGWIRYAEDADGASHDYVAPGGDPLWLSVWLDLNQDCVWVTPGERFIHGSVAPPPPGPVPGLRIIGGAIPLPPAVPSPSRPVWLRARLDWGEDVGAAANVDGTLLNTEGAAQFGEVEDYPFWCFSKYKQLYAENKTPEVKRGIQMIYIGDCPEAQNFGAIVDSLDCVLVPIPEIFHNVSYNLTSDETSVDIFGPSEIVSPGTRVHTGRCQPESTWVLGNLRASWLREDLQPPSTDDWLPSTNSGICPTIGGLLVSVGAVNETIGGKIGGRDSTGNWNDTVHVNVSYRASPVFVPLENLSPCDPFLSSLPKIPVGGANITPESPMQFMLDFETGITPDTPFLILEIESNWTLNGNSSSEIVEFTNIFDPISTGIDDSSVPPRTGFDLRNEPNPFNATTTIVFEAPERTEVTLRVYDLRGALIRTLVDHEIREAGTHRVTWTGLDDLGREIASGMYFYQLESRGDIVSRKMVLLR